MSELRVHAEDRPIPEAVFHDFADIRRELGALGVNFERCEPSRKGSKRAECESQFVPPTSNG